MKKLILLLLSSIFAVSTSFSQSPIATGHVGINTATPDSTSILDIVSSDKGILIPRLTKSQRDSIASPAKGLLIFQNDSINLGFYFYDGTKWRSITNRGSDNSTLIYTSDGF